MKRTVLFILILSCLFLCACGEVPSVTYALQSAALDGEPVEGVTSSLTLAEDGSGLFSLNGNSCRVTWSEAPFTVQINDMTATGTRSGDSAELMLGESGLVLYYNCTLQPQELPEAPQGTAYEGRFWFSNCSGVWEDYDGRSMALSGTVSEEAITLYSQYFSEEVPMLVIELEKGDCAGGYVLNFPLKAFDAVITNSVQRRSDVNKTTFLNPEDYIWYVEPEFTPPPEEMTDVITVSGSVRNAEGALSYEANIIPVITE